MSDSTNLHDVLLAWTAVFMRRSMHDFLRFARRSGLSMTQLNVLMHIHYHGACEIRGLLALLEVSKAAAGQLVERMEQQGLVERGPAPRDRRARLVSLTPRGRELVEAGIAARQAWLDGLVLAMPAEGQAEISRSLARLAEQAEKLNTLAED
jgi:DNA-binding MarR family transcriptional regulator